MMMDDCVQFLDFVGLNVVWCRVACLCLCYAATLPPELSHFFFSPFRRGGGREGGCSRRGSLRLRLRFRLRQLRRGEPKIGHFLPAGNHWTQTPPQTQRIAMERNAVECNAVRCIEIQLWSASRPGDPILRLYFEPWSRMTVGDRDW